MILLIVIFIIIINYYHYYYIHIYVVDRRLNSELLIAHSFWDDHPN